MPDIDTGSSPDWGSDTQEAVTTAWTDSGIPYQTVSPTSDNFYKVEGSWITPSEVLGVTNKNDSHYGVQELNHANYDTDVDASLARIGREGQQGELDAVNGEIAGTILRTFQEGFDSPSFDDYLASDDEGYLSVNLPQPLLDVLQNQYDISSDVARSYIYHVQPTRQQLETFAKVLGVDINPSTVNPIRPSETESINPSNDKPWEQFPQQALDTAYNSDNAVSDLDNIRGRHFPGATDKQWSSIMNQVLDRFEQLPKAQQAKYDSPEGFSKLFELGRNHKAQFQTGTQTPTRQQQTQQTKRTTPKGAPSGALTSDGRLKQSWLNKLTNEQYEKQGAKIDKWLNNGMIDYNA